MRVLIIGKYPPLQGGVSAQTYWTARALANRGYDVDVITNATEAPQGLRAILDGDAEQWCSGSVGHGRVRVHLTEGLARNSYLPWSNPFASKLFGRALDVIGPDGCDGILGWYLEPFGLVAAMAGMATGSPVVLRHAGSDLGRLAHHSDLRVSYSWMLGQARAGTHREPRRRRRENTAGKPRTGRNAFCAGGEIAIAAGLLTDRAAT